MHHCIIAGRSDARAVGRPCYATDLFSMTSIGEDGLTCSSIPYLYCAIIACRSDASAIRRLSYSVHLTGMPTIGEDVAASDHIPYLHVGVRASGSNLLAVRRPGHRSDEIEVVSIDQ